jgi:Concanavalin A-like lectin/glucanases superfamily/Secretion system C-terminal sorting domain
MKNRLLSLVLLLFTAFGVGGQVPSYVPTNGLVGYWPFNGNANDESGNGNNGTVIGGVSNTTDRFGEANAAYLFNGIDGYIDVPSLNSLAYTPITYSAWVIINSYFPSSFGHKFRSIIGRNTTFITENGVIGFYADNNVAGGVYDNTFLMWRGGGNSGNAAYSASIPPLNTWLHVVYTQNSNGDWRWYQNGILTNSSSFIDLQNDFNYFRIGGCNHDGGYLWNDKLDDIGIWNRALTADEVLALYNGCNLTPQVVTGNTTPSAFSNSTYTCNNNAGSTYAWTVSNGVIASGQGTNTIDVLWGAEGVGSVAVTETTADGCVSDAVVYDVNVQCIVSGNAITGPVGPEAFSSSTYTCNGAVNSTYNWTVTNGVIASGQGTNTVNILWASTGLGNVSVVETTAEGCVGTSLSQDVVVIPTNIEELSNQLILFPNPVTTELNLQTTSDLIGTDLFIFDALGKQIMKQQILSTNTTINTLAFAAGNYVVKVGGVVKKFTVEK